MRLLHRSRTLWSCRRRSGMDPSDRTRRGWAGLVVTRWKPSVLYLEPRWFERRCIWARPLHPQTKVPTGPAFEIRHFRGGSEALNSGAFGSGLTKDRLLFLCVKSKAMFGWAIRSSNVAVWNCGISGNGLQVAVARIVRRGSPQAP
jgi:hypothetical protein